MPAIRRDHYSFRVSLTFMIQTGGRVLLSVYLRSSSRAHAAPGLPVASQYSAR